MGRKEYSETTRRAFVAGVGAAGISGTVGTVAGKPKNGNGFPPKGRTEYSDPVTLGDGEVKTFVTDFPHDKWTYVGVELSAEAATIDSEVHDHLELRVIPFPEGTEFEYLLLDWGPTGHGPAGVYDVPHHDLHFYREPLEEIRQIPPINYDLDDLHGIPEEFLDQIPTDDIDQEPYVEPIAEDQYPDGYFRSNYVVPMMGEHLYDATAPEWDGPGEPSDEDFTHTHVYGHWDGDLIFFEPMITVDFFENLDQSVTTEITTPERMPEAGEYPTEYTIAYHQNRDAYTVTMGAFESFEESNGTN